MSSNTNDENLEEKSRRHRIGYWWSDKKSQKLNGCELAKLFAERQCDLIKLDLDRPFEEQGPFSVIVHKLSDYLVKAGQGDAQACKIIKSFENYCRKHPDTVILDPLDNNRFLLDRFQQYRTIAESDLAREGVLFTPTFVHLTSTNIDVNRGRIKRSKITFPIVCKPILAQGSQVAHQMCIIFNEAGLKDVKPPCVAQSFVNHNAKLFKLFVIKDKYYVMERPSLKNFHAGNFETVFFFSHDISKSNSCSLLTELDEEDKLKLEQLNRSRKNEDNNTISQKSNKIHLEQHDDMEDKLSNTAKSAACQLIERESINGEINGLADVAEAPLKDGSAPIIQETLASDHIENSRQISLFQHSPLRPDREILAKIVKAFSEKLGLTFYGLDLIIENGTSRFAIIDMNTFPGYDGVEDFLTVFRDVVCDAIPNELNQTHTGKIGKRKPKEFDSGIEST